MFALRFAPQGGDAGHNCLTLRLKHDCKNTPPSPLATPTLLSFLFVGSLMPEKVICYACTMNGMELIDKSHGTTDTCYGAGDHGTHGLTAACILQFLLVVLLGGNARSGTYPSGPRAFQIHLVRSLNADKSG